MKKSKLFIPIICFISLIFCNSLQGNSSFSNLLPKSEKKVNLKKIKKKNIFSRFQKKRKKIQNIKFFKRKKVASVDTKASYYGDISAFLYGVALLCYLTTIISPLTFFAGIIFNIISLVFAQLGKNKDMNTRLAKKMYRVNLATLGTAVLLLLLVRFLL